MEEDEEIETEIKHRGSPRDVPRPFPCDACGGLFKRLNHYADHLTRFPDGACRPDESRILCPICRRSFCAKEDLARHVCCPVQIPPAKKTMKRKSPSVTRNPPKPFVTGPSSSSSRDWSAKYKGPVSSFREIRMKESGPAMSETPTSPIATLATPATSATLTTFSAPHVVVSDSGAGAYTLIDLDTAETRVLENEEDSSQSEQLPSSSDSRESRATGLPKIKCPDCQTRCESAAEFFSHSCVAFAQHQQQNTDFGNVLDLTFQTSRSHICMDCGETFSELQGLIGHALNQHGHLLIGFPSGLKALTGTAQSGELAPGQGAVPIQPLPSTGFASSSVARSEAGVFYQRNVVLTVGK